MRKPFAYYFLMLVGYAGIAMIASAIGYSIFHGRLGPFDIGFLGAAIAFISFSGMTHSDFDR